MKNTFLFAIIILSGGIFATAQTGFNPSGKPIVQVFGWADFNLTQDAQKQYSFAFDRAHFGYEYTFDPKWSARIIIDRGRPTSIGRIAVFDSTGQSLDVSNTSKEGSFYTMTLKFASLEWKPSEKFRLQGGAVLQNHYITQEKFWGLRYVAETFQDRYFRTPSSDLGFIAYWSPSDKFGADLAITNGEGFRTDQDAYGKVKIAGGVDYKPSERWQTRIFYDAKATGDTLHSAPEQTVSLFAGFKIDKKFRIGADATYRINHQHYFAKDVYGFSLFAAKSIFKDVELFCRYDRLMAGNSQSNLLGWSNYTGPGHACIGGVHYSPAKGVALSLNYQGWLSDIQTAKTQHHVFLSFEYKI